ncbi:MAG: hypothetical protein IPJ18_13110 [Betaproteobacteria bacterium]|nr:hypothetical protein [Betaproteobacteria bacterium]
MISTIPFEIPAEFLGRVASGELVRYGTILKDAGTGQIVKHLQETGVAQSVLRAWRQARLPQFPILADVVGAGANVYAGLKIDQLKAMMETLQSLQVATLGVSLAGVGVSVAGFYYMHKRFNSLENRMDELSEAIKAGFESLGHRSMKTTVTSPKASYSVHSRRRPCLIHGLSTRKWPLDWPTRRPTSRVKSHSL